MPGEEEELVNEGTYGKAFALYLRDALVQNGFQATQVACEDWGWWVTVAGLPFSCGIGIYGMRIDDSDMLDLCVTVLTPRGKQWSWGRFRLVDTTADVDRLHEAIREICADDDEVTIVAETPDFPL